MPKFNIFWCLMEWIIFILKQPKLHARELQWVWITVCVTKICIPRNAYRSGMVAIAVNCIPHCVSDSYLRLFPPNHKERKEQQCHQFKQSTHVLHFECNDCHLWSTIRVGTLIVSALVWAKLMPSSWIQQVMHRQRRGDQSPLQQRPAVCPWMLLVPNQFTWGQVRKAFILRAYLFLPPLSCKCSYSLA